MKKLLALLLAFLLALPSGAALAQEGKTGILEKVGNSLTELRDSVQEKAEEAGKAISEKAGEIAGQAQEKAQEAGKAISEKAGEIAGQAQEKAEEAGKAISEKAGNIVSQAQEKAKEAGKAISEKAGDFVDQAQEKAKEAGKAISEKAGEIAGQAQEKAKEAGKAISEKAGDIVSQAQEKAKEAGKAISEKAGDFVDQAQEKAEETGKAISEKAGEIAGQIQKVKEELPGKARDASMKLGLKAMMTWWKVQNAVEEGKEKAADLLDLAKDGLQKNWKNVKKVAVKAVKAVKAFIQAKLQQLLDWIMGNEDAGGQAVASRVLYYDVFYFGMPLSEAKALGLESTLGAPTVDEQNGVQYWTIGFTYSQDTAMILFDGLGEDAPLSEIICAVVDDEGAVNVTEENAASQETIDAVYNSISSWFSDKMEISLGDDLLLPIYPNALAGGSAVSRVRLFVYADGDGCDAATHFVLTGENGSVNMVQFQYMDAAKLEALLAE